MKSHSHGRSLVCSLGLVVFIAGCPPPATTPADSGTPDVVPADASRPDGGTSARGAATCARLRMLNCSNAAMCESSLSPSSLGIPARCAPLFDAFVDCLDRSAATLTCDQFSMSPTVCTAEFSAVGACAMSDAGAPSDSGVVDASASLEGTVLVTVLNRVNESSRETVIASARRGAEPEPCMRLQDDGARCVYSTCSDLEDTRPYVSAGDITLVQNSIRETMSPDAMMRYPNLTDLDFAAGAAVGVVIAGGSGIPSRTINLEIGSRSPRFSLSEPTNDATVERARALPIRWTAEDLGSIEITLRNGVHRIECQGLPRSGSLEISSALLMRLPAGATTLSAVHLNDVGLIDAGWKFTISALLASNAPTTINLR